MLRILIRDDRHPGRKRRDSALVLRVEDDVRDHRIGRYLGDLREHRFLGVDRILVIDDDDAGGTNDEPDVGDISSNAAARKVDVVFEFGDGKRLFEPEFIDVGL